MNAPYPLICLVLSLVLFAVAAFPSPITGFHTTSGSASARGYG